MNNPYETLDILITGGTLLTMEPPGDIIADPVIGIRDGRIIFVEEGGAARGELPEAREVLDGSGCLVMPGLVNTHTHLPMVLFRGLADDLPLMRWLNDHIFPAEERFIDRETVYAGTQLAIAEMILSGTTTFCDGYFFESSVARAAVEAGMRGIVAQGFIDFPAPDQQSSAEKAAVAGIVSSHAVARSRSTSQRTLFRRSAAPTPMMAELMTCVVLTGPPTSAAPKITDAPAICDAKPWIGRMR